VIVRAVVGTVALLLGTASEALLLETISERHSPGAYILLVTAGAACLIVSLALLLGLLAMLAALDR
jgi:hypothetical protein